jgi:sortase A
MLCVLEVVFLVAGTALLVVFGVARLDGLLASRAAIRHFEAATPGLDAKRAEPSVPNLQWPNPVDFSPWAPARIRAYRQSQADNRSLPLAIVRIPRIHLAAPVFNGTDALTLNRGVGRIEGTALPGGGGNLGIAGHRDGFFRGLKDVSRGDMVELATIEQTSVYVIDQIEVVAPSDIGVLSPRSVASLMLVTCYPFYYIGSAPKRYVVEATLKGELRKHDQRSLPLRGNANQGGTGK